MDSVSILVQLAVNGLLKGGVYALLAVGLTITYGVVKLVNFAHGEFIMLAMYATFFLFSSHGINPFWGLLIVVPVFFLVGQLSYRLVFGRLVETGVFAQVFTTAGLSLVLQNAALMAWRGEPRMVTMPELSKVISVGPLNASFVEVIGFAFAAVLMIALFAFFKYTYTGKAINAVVEERRGAMLVGLNVKALYQLALGIGFACIGAAGAILVTIYYAIPAVGDTWKFIAFIAVVLGGYDSLPGTVIAALLIGLIESFSGFFLAVHLKECMYFMVFLVFLLFRPSGILGRSR